MLLTEYDEKKHMKHIYEEGKLEGYERVNKLYDRLLTEGRNEDLKKALKDPEYLEKLFKEYGL